MTRDPSSDHHIYETLDIHVSHDGTNAPSLCRVIHPHRRHGVFTQHISGDDVRLRGTISNTNTHTVTVVRRLMNI